MRRTSQEVRRTSPRISNEDSIKFMKCGVLLRKCDVLFMSVTELSLIWHLLSCHSPPINRGRISPISCIKNTENTLYKSKRGVRRSRKILEEFGGDFGA